MSVYRVTQVLSSPPRLLRMTYECTENAGCHDRRKTARHSTIERTTPVLRRSRRRPAVNTSAWIGNDRDTEAARIAPCVLRIRIRGRTVGKLQACIHLAACRSEVALACGGELELYSYKNASGGAPLPPSSCKLAEPQDSLFERFRKFAEKRRSSAIGQCTRNRLMNALAPSFALPRRDQARPPDAPDHDPEQSANDGC